MNFEQMKSWIDNASYEMLLSKWRFEPIGSPWFCNEIGDYFVETMKKKREEILYDEQVETSKRLGWG